MILVNSGDLIILELQISPEVWGAGNTVSKIQMCITFTSTGFLCQSTREDVERVCQECKTTLLPSDAKVLKHSFS